MTLSLDLYWSFRSPYCYFALRRLVPVVAEYDLRVVVRPVVPLAIRHPEVMAADPPQASRYFDLDTRRVAAFLDVPYAYPEPDPLVMEADGVHAAPDQPYIGRLNHLGLEAERRGGGFAFLDAVSRVIWGGRVKAWHSGDHLREAAARAGLDLDAMDAALAADPGTYDRMLAENARGLAAAGHWGTPTMVFADEPFFGQDRVEVLLWRLKAHGLERRA